MRKQGVPHQLILNNPQNKQIVHLISPWFNIKQFVREKHWDTIDMLLADHYNFKYQFFFAS
jgi:hypothetical protein